VPTYPYACTACDHRFEQVQAFTDTPPQCDAPDSSAGGAAFYCPDGDFIAWDAQTLVPQLQEDFGPLLVGVVTLIRA